MPLNQRKLFPLFIGIVLLIVSAGCAPKPTIIHVPLKPSATIGQTEIVSTPTKQPPTRTPSLEPSFTATHTVVNSPTSPSMITLTYTPEPANLIIQQDTVCLSGTSFSHDIQQYVEAGSIFAITGQLADGSWWMVDIENNGSCWVYGEYTSVAGLVGDVPVLTPPPLPSLTPTPQPATAGIYYILISPDTGGPFGCGDSLIYFYPGVWVKGDMEADITAALNALFGNHNQYTNGLYNPIYQSQLKAKGVEVVGNEVIVRLAGTLVRPKDSCESQRMHDQIWYTVSQFSPTRAIIYLNNALLGDLLVVSKN